MAVVLFGLAAFLTVAIVSAHVLRGSPVVIPPLMATESLPENVQWLLYFTWHVGSVVLVVCAAAFTYLAVHPENSALAYFATATVASIGLLGLSMAVFGNAALFASPAPYAFNVITIVALAGVLLR